MPTFIQHRVNRLEQLHHLPDGFGAEIDLRSDVASPGDLHLAHDPFVKGESFRAWLAGWAQRPRGPLVLNTKEDGLEPRALDMMQHAGVSSFFFLDTQLPTLVRLAREGLGRHLALRLSAFEPATALSVWRTLPVTQRPRVLWVDCFSALPLSPAVLAPLASDFAPCLVSPELQGQTPPDLSPFVGLAAHCETICTKQPGLWAAALQPSAP